MVRQSLSNAINDHKTQGEWKTQLTMAINFISKDSGETGTMHAKSNNIGTMIGNETDENIKILFESLLERYQEGLEKSTKGSEFIFNSVDLFYYKFYRISLNWGGLYAVSPNWLKNKKTTINSKNDDDKCF